MNKNGRENFGAGNSINRRPGGMSPTPPSHIHMLRSAELFDNSTNPPDQWDAQFESNNKYNPNYKFSPPSNINPLIRSERVLFPSEENYLENVKLHDGDELRRHQKRSLERLIRKRARPTTDENVTCIGFSECKNILRDTLKIGYEYVSIHILHNFLRCLAEFLNVLRYLNVNISIFANKNF